MILFIPCWSTETKKYMVNSCKWNINNSIIVESCVEDTNYYTVLLAYDPCRSAYFLKGKKSKLNLLTFKNLKNLKKPVSIIYNCNTVTSNNTFSVQNKLVD